jgi:hypothetical protein
MPCMPEIITKGAIMRKLDDVMNNPESRRALRAALAAAPATANGFVNAGDGIHAGYWNDMLNAQEKKHFLNDWFTPLESGGWWCIEKGVVEKVLRRALITLIKKADECCARWVDCYWACAHQHDHTCHVADEPDEEDTEKYLRYKKKQCRDLKAKLAAGDLSCEEGLDRVECSITWSHAQITFIVHTPPPPNGYALAAGMTFPEPIQVVKWHRSSSALQVVQPKWQPYP